MRLRFTDAIESKIVEESLAANKAASAVANNNNNSVDTVTAVKFIPQKPQPKKLKITLKK
jgi:hypothetical protein